MLDDDVARTNVDPTRRQVDNSLPLLTAFLNPPEYFNGGTPPARYTPEQAAGAIVMGSSDQVGNELDEFVDRDAAQQPARSAARPADDQHDPRP